MTALSLSILITPIYTLGYDACPIELWFAAFKSEDINPRHVPTGKSHFRNVVELVYRRARQISKEHRVLLWHHVLAEQYKYLIFERL